jgi:hypothetical protein
MEQPQMSKKSRAILEAIAKGHTYEQILVQELAWTYHDIFKAAAEALSTACNPTIESGKSYDVESIRHEHPKAYEKWDAVQDAELRQLFQAGKTVPEIASSDAAADWGDSQSFNKTRSYFLLIAHSL